MKSMTGFGKSHTNRHNIECDIEIKSVNGRFLDIKCYLPRELSFFEFELRKATSKYLSRGSIEIRVNINDYREPKLRLNELKLRKYYDIIKQAQKSLEIDRDVSMEFLLNEPGVIENCNQLNEDEELHELLIHNLDMALKAICVSMEKEAKDIKDVLSRSLDKIGTALEQVESAIQPYKKELFDNMNKRINEIVGNYQLENTEQRLIQELALYIDKYDVQEEITRLKSHIDTFFATMSQEREVGKALNFILQEMQREANTLGSKFSNNNTFSDVLIIKEEIEKCREIVQNVS
ncbi:MAG: YicC family protein [Candidatus Cloacimonetes bacterium]|nr:YicC family protein [Candidatus Cloacimonadota bacterium]MDD2719065.1 YicC family protein [Candidatus Cloacimonadota bacterium]MDD4790790.1 YicC family protein [Candidatus Cloacimonadota bacterium]MDD4814956.1 YicC family protein [Candidatus Cloacimonadota bacterium]MDD5535979.1 YicC family protein [Candidatus Cloacimonadota bacterium]